MTITKTERDELIEAAKASISLTPDGEIVGGYTAAWQSFAAEHGISSYRARQYVAKAARLLRGEALTPLGRPGQRGVEVTIYITKQQAQIASWLGDGNVSAGVRLALDKANL